jgi:Leucine-rich repeat (LRR) protein
VIENISHLTRLHTLNLSHNHIRKLEGLECLENLKTLDVSHNLIADIKDCEQAVHLPALTSFDLRDNHISQHEEILPFFERMPKLNLLYLRGNPCVRNISQYRRSMTIAIPELVYFDERPIWKIDRLGAQAFLRGGKEEEAKVRYDYLYARQLAEQRITSHNEQVQKEGKAKRKAAFKDMMEKVKEEKGDLLERRKILREKIKNAE